MSWFDTASLANIAKTALKGAQRTIDKALDIKEEEEESSVSSNVPFDTNSEDFFDSWGISSLPTTKDSKNDAFEDVVTKSPTKSKLTTSLWGSFSGSFFDTSKEMMQVESKSSIESLDDSPDLGEEHFNKSKLVVQQSEDGDSIFFATLSSDKHERTDEKTIKMEAKTETESSISSKTTETFTSENSCSKTPESDLLSPGLSLSASSSDMKEKSQSVEVIPDSLTSPSSVEILSSEPTNSNTDVHDSEENMTSSLCSDIEEKNWSKSEKSSPDSVEIIQENADECSFASASESTILEADLLLQQSRSFENVFKNEDKALTSSENFDTKHADVHHERQIKLKSLEIQPQNKSLIETSNVIDIPKENQSFFLDTHESNIDDEGSQSDRTIIASTDNVMESSSDTNSSNTENNTNSMYFKTMIADAMNEKSFISVEDVKISEQKACKNMELLHKKEDLIDMSMSQLEMRELSSQSSESRSDIVKIESDQMSGHTSGDEIETTTSSDIEIISSPNGDSSSTHSHSRHSPAKMTGLKQRCSEANVDMLLGKMAFKKVKGHNRELSEASSISDDSSEIDRLIKRISEMTEILESREMKLIEMNRNNAELHEININLQKQLDMMLTKQMESVDLSQVTEEYTRRMSVLEKKFQQAIREKDNLQKQLEQAKQEAASRMSKGELEALINEKDETIKELREEGEKLSKQQLQHSNIIKKLRAKEKEYESSLKKLRETIEDLTSENERLKRTLAAKDEVEHSQIEAVHQLTAKNKKLEYEVTQLQSQFDDLTNKYDTVKKSLDAAKKELNDKNRANSELQARQQMLKSLENEKRMTESQNEEILSQVEDLRLKLQEADQELVRREQHLKAENNELLKRLEEAEARNEELAQSVMEVSKPLVRQLEALQATYNMKLTSFEKIEQELTSNINELQNKLQSITGSERLQKEECLSLRSKVSSLEMQLSTAQHQIEMLNMDVEQVKTERMIAEREMKSEIDELKAKLKQGTEMIENLTKEKQQLEQQLSIDRCEAEKKRNFVLQEQVHDKSDSLAHFTKMSPSGTRNTSPTLSVDRISLSESLGSSVFLTDDQVDIPTPARFNNILELQMLQTNLKQKEGEVQQLQWELNRREHERTLLNTQISNLLTRVEALEVNLAEHESLRTQFADLQRQYDTLCQLYGEKVEEAEELKLDLQDVKELYKTQLDDLLKHQQKD